MRLFTSYLYLSGAEVASKLVTFAAVAFLARVVGPESYGHVEFAAAVMLCAGLIVDQGFGAYGAREIAKAPERTPALVSEIVAARFILAVVAYSAVVLFALLLGRSSLVTQLLLIYGLSLFGAPLLLSWVFQGHRQMRTVAAMQVIRQTLFAAVVFGFVRAPTQVWIVGIAELSGICGAAAYGLWSYSRCWGARLDRPAFSRRLFREGVPIGLSQMFWMVRMYGATALLGLVAPPEEVGFFGGAMRILVALHAFVWLYFFNLFPSLSQTWGRDKRDFDGLIAESLRSLAWIVAACGLVWVLAAPLAIMAVYGLAFLPAGGALQWLAGVWVAAAVSGHYRFGLIAAGQQRVEMLISALGALMALLLVPAGYARADTAGAAMGLVVAEIVVWLSAWWWAERRLALSGQLPSLVRPVIATVLSLAMLGVVPLSSEIERSLVALSAMATLAFVLDGRVRMRIRPLAFGRHLRNRGAVADGVQEISR